MPPGRNYCTRGPRPEFSALIKSQQKTRCGRKASFRIRVFRTRLGMICKARKGTAQCSAVTSALRPFALVERSGLMPVLANDLSFSFGQAFAILVLPLSFEPKRHFLEALVPLNCTSEFLIILRNSWLPRTSRTGPLFSIAARLRDADIDSRDIQALEVHHRAKN